MATTKSRLVQDYWHPAPLYERWLDTLDIPVHREYFVDDLRTLPLGPWEERECNAAIVVLAGQEGVTEARITEIPPGSTMPALKFSLDEIVYVLEGKGTVHGMGRQRGGRSGASSGRSTACSCFLAATFTS